jgi:hypothetical protein
MGKALRPSYILTYLSGLVKTMNDELPFEVGGGIDLKKKKNCGRNLFIIGSSILFSYKLTMGDTPLLNLELGEKSQ